MCDVKLFLTFTSLNLLLLWQLFYLFCSSIVIYSVIVTAGTFEPYWKWEVWRFKIWFNPPFLYKCLYQVRVITVLTVFRLLIDFVCLYTYEFWLSLCKIVRSSVILLLLLCSRDKTYLLNQRCTGSSIKHLYCVGGNLGFLS